LEILKYGAFTSVQDVKDRLNELLKCQVTDIGYIESGHRREGKQRTLINNDDIDGKYDVYKRTNCGITLRCYTCADGGTKCPSKNADHWLVKIEPHFPSERMGLLKIV